MEKLLVLCQYFQRAHGCIDEVETSQIASEANITKIDRSDPIGLASFVEAS